MPDEHAIVPFTIANAYGGWAECHGVLSASVDGLKLEFESRDGFLGMLKSRVRVQLIPWAEVADVKLHAGWFRTCLWLTATTLRSLQRVPGTQASQVCLVVKRQHRDAARQLAFTANLQLCERELRRARSTPPPPDASPP